MANDQIDPDEQANADALAQYATELLASVYRVTELAIDVGRALRWFWAFAACAYLFQLWLILEILEAVQQ